jgi:hypothetical protein
MHKIYEMKFIVPDKFSKRDGDDENRKKKY